ncbi:MAG: DUF7003 family protein [Polyangiales bacterium]
MSDLRETFENEPDPQQPHDARDLWPVDVARSFLNSLKPPLPRFKNHDVTDRMWCALLSLADAAEFVAQARRLAPVPDPRGHYNVAVHERYGDEILPWVADHFEATTATLHNVPWNIMPLLLRIGSESAFEIVYRSQNLDAPTDDWDEPEKLLAAYVARFPNVAFASLGRRIVAGEAAAAAAFKKLAKGRSRAALAALSHAVGDVERDRIAKELKLSAHLEEDEILGVLDQAAATDEMYAWPRFSYDFEDRVEYTALRLVAVRSRSSERWGIALERITGCDMHEIDVQRFCFGSDVPPGFPIGDSVHSPPAVTFELDGGEDSAIGATVRGAAGSVTLTKELVKSLDLRPGKGTEPEGGVGGPAVVLLRAYMASFPGAVWPPVEDAIRALKLDPQDAVVVACTDAFAHVDGKAPSTSKAYKSAAKAIVAADPSKFDPGTPNTDWRKHARFKADG